MAEIFLSLNNTIKSNVLAVRNMVEYLIICDFIFTGPIIAAIPAIMQMLNRLLPIILPMAILPFPAPDKRIFVSKAGALIAKATTVKPVTKGDIPDLIASAEDPFSRYDAPK